jgi:predicted nucleotidyltransferase/HEPN domain-containing protein
MRTDLDHLPPANQRELRMVADTILDQFEEAHARGASQWRKRGRIHKIILYGSYARGDWVYEPHTKKGYRSDYDLLIVVNHKRVADNGDFWEGLREHFADLLEKGRMKVPVGIIVHTRQHLNNALAQGRYFFVDVARDGIALYQDDDKPLPTPRPKTAASELAMANEYFDERYAGAGAFYDAYVFNFERGSIKNAAFQLHQSVEQLYHTVLLVSTLYTAHVHNIRHLRNEAAKIDRRFLYVWPEDTHWQRSAFNLLKEAYVKARYTTYRVDADQLRWLGEQAQELARVTEIVCREHITALERRVAESSARHDHSKRAPIEAHC